MQPRETFKRRFTMIHKKLLASNSVAALLTIALVFVFIQLWNSPLHNLMNEVIALAIYGLLIASYLLGLVLVLFGVFSVYKILREHVNSQDYKRTEVQVGLK